MLMMLYLNYCIGMKCEPLLLVIQCDWMRRHMLLQLRVSKYNMASKRIKVIVIFNHACFNIVSIWFWLADTQNFLGAFGRRNDFLVFRFQWTSIYLQNKYIQSAISKDYHIIQMKEKHPGLQNSLFWYLAPQNDIFRTHVAIAKTLFWLYFRSDLNGLKVESSITIQ